MLGVSDDEYIVSETDVSFSDGVICTASSRLISAIIDIKGQIWIKENKIFTKLLVQGNFKLLAIDGPYIVALDDEGSVWALGDDGYCSFGQTLTKIEGLPPISMIYINCSLSTIFCIDTNGELWIYGGCWYDFAKLEPFFLNQLPPIQSITVCNDILWILDTNNEVWAYDTHQHTFNAETVNNPCTKITQLSNIVSLCSGENVVVFLDCEKCIWELHLCQNVMRDLRPQQIVGRGLLKHSIKQRRKLKLEELQFVKITNISNIISVSCEISSYINILLLDSNGEVWRRSSNSTYIIIDSNSKVASLVNSSSNTSQNSKVKSGASLL